MVFDVVFGCILGVLCSMPSFSTTHDFCAEVMHLNDFICPGLDHCHVQENVTLVDVFISHELLLVFSAIAANLLEDEWNSLLQGFHDLANFCFLGGEFFLLVLGRGELLL